MSKYDFWNDWKNLTDKESDAIKGIIDVRGLVIRNIPKREIVSMYVKGSFVRREMNDKSDVDTATIVRHPKYLETLEDLDYRYKPGSNIRVHIGGYALSELQDGKRRGKVISQTPPVRFVKHLEYYKLIYGEQLDPRDYFTKSDKELLKGLHHFVSEKFLPLYEGKLSFSQIVKQVFWLVEGEARVRGMNPPYNWEGLADLFPDSEHIIHLTYLYRQKEPTDEKTKSEYIRRLEEYLKGLEKLI